MNRGRRAGVLAILIASTLLLASDRDDDASTIQESLDAAAGAGGIVSLPPGCYLLKSGLRIPTGVTLQGSWQAPHHGVVDKGTTLLAGFGAGKEDGPALIELAPSSAVRGITILYPDQKLEDVKPYPWAIHGTGMHCTVENVTLVNAYQGIAMGPEWNELHLIRNVYGCVLRRGVFIDNTTDIGRIENVHFNPHYWPRSGHDGVTREGNPDQAVANYMRKNLEAFIFGRTDWQYCTNTFVYGARVGYRFTRTPNGACNGQFLGIAADGGGTCIVAERSQSCGILITNGQFVSLGGDGIVTTESYESALQLDNCSFWGTIRRVAHLRGPGHVSLDQCTIHPDQGPLEVTAGSFALTASHFGRDSGQVIIGEGVASAIVSGNTFTASARIEIPEGPPDRYHVSGNVTRP